LTDVDARITAMDTAGVAVQLLSSWIDLTSYALPPEPGERLARLFNEAVAEMVTATPDRFLGMCTVPLQAPSARRRRCAMPWRIWAWSASRSPRPSTASFAWLAGHLA
jgi:predicted TIM-barrel fold metal-dependent hydrolase